MSRISRSSSTSTIRRPPASTRPVPRPAPPASTANRSIARGTRATTRGRATHTQLTRTNNNNNNIVNNENADQQAPETSVHVGDGYHMFIPSVTKREQIRRQAENEQRQYEAHIERKRLHNIHEVHRLGGSNLSEEEVRRQQAEKYRQDKFIRLEKSHQEQLDRKQREEKDIEAKRQAAREQAMENARRNRSAQLHSTSPTTNQQDQGATGWTDTDREADRRETMDRFLNRLTHQCDDMNISSDKNDASKSEKLSILREMLPHLDDQTLEYHLEIFNGNIDAIVAELAN